MTSAVRHPEVLWAQRTETLLITINLRDIKNETVELLPNRITFKGESDGEKYAFDIELYAEVVPEESKQAKTDFRLAMIVKKKDEDQPYWPRLQKEKTKLAFLRTDFNQWRDEDEQDEQPEANAGIQGGFPGMEGMDFSQFAGAGGDMNFDAMMGGGEEDDEEDNEEANAAS